MNDCVTNYITNSTEQRLSWEVNILWKQKVYYGIHKSPPPVPVLSQIDSVHAPHHISGRSILAISFHLRLNFSSGFFPSDVPTKTLYAHLHSPIHAKWPDHLILLGLITRIIFGEGCRSLSSLLYSLHSSDPLKTKFLSERLGLSKYSWN
jgi:hypothetical protein